MRMVGVEMRMGSLMLMNERIAIEGIETRFKLSMEYGVLRKY